MDFVFSSVFSFGGGHTSSLWVLPMIWRGYVFVGHEPGLARDYYTYNRRTGFWLRRNQ